MTSIPKASAIAKYWYNYACKVYDAGKADRLPPFAQHLLIDLGEPNCWGCNRPLGYDISGWTVKEAIKNFDRIHHIERAHIIPASRGGSVHPRNLVLLCSKCHRDAPDVTNPRHFFTWLKNRPKASSEMELQRLVMAAQELGLDRHFAIRMFIVVNAALRKEFLDYYFDHAIEHFGAEPKMTTDLAAMFDFLKNKRHDAYMACDNDDSATDYILSRRGIYSSA